MRSHRGPPQIPTPVKKPKKAGGATPRKISVLPANRARNIEILVRGLSCSVDQVATTIVELGGEGADALNDLEKLDQGSILAPGDSVIK